MELKRFVAKDVKSALQLISEELGPEAVILSNQKVAEGVEISAALDYDPDLYMQYSLQKKQEQEQLDAIAASQNTLSQNSASKNPPVHNYGNAARSLSASSEIITAESMQQKNPLAQNNVEEEEGSESLEWLRKYGGSIFKGSASEAQKAKISSALSQANVGADKARLITESLQRREEPSLEQSSIENAARNANQTQDKTVAQSTIDTRVSGAMGSLNKQVERGEISQLKQELELLKRQLEDESDSHSDNQSQRADCVTNISSASDSYESRSTDTTVDSGRAKKQRRPNTPTFARLVSKETQKLQPLCTSEHNSSVSSDLLSEKDCEILKLRSELGLIKELYQTSVNQTQWEVLTVKRPTTVELYSRCKRVGFPGELINKHMKSLPLDELTESDLDEAYKTLLRNISNSIRLYIPRKQAGTKITAIFGPTGSGKTTTIAKLAAQFAIKHGADKLAIVTTDVYRLGAFEQLKVLGKILNVPIRVANDKTSLSDIVSGLDKKKLVLIDSAGMSPEEDGWQAQLEQFEGLQQPYESLVVLPATAHESYIKQVLLDYSAFPLNACIVSKLDQAHSLGGLIGVVSTHKIPVSHISTGQQIPADIEFGRRDTLVKKALRVSGDRLVETDLAIDFFSQPTANEVSHSSTGRANDVKQKATNTQDLFTEDLATAKLASDSFDKKSVNNKVKSRKIA